MADEKKVSGRFGWSWDDTAKMGKSLLIAACGAALLGIAQWMDVVDWKEYGLLGVFVAPFAGAIANAIKLWVKNNTKLVVGMFLFCFLTLPMGGCLTAQKVETGFNLGLSIPTPFGVWTPVNADIHFNIENGGNKVLASEVTGKESTGGNTVVPSIFGDDK